MRSLVTLVTRAHTPERKGDEEQCHQTGEGKQGHRDGWDRRRGVRPLSGGREDGGHNVSLPVDFPQYFTRAPVGITSHYPRVCPSP